MTGESACGANPRTARDEGGLAIVRNDWRAAPDGRGMTVHLPPALLVVVQRKASALGVSRNRVVVLALEAFVSDEIDAIQAVSAPRVEHWGRAADRGKKPPSP